MDHREFIVILVLTVTLLAIEPHAFAQMACRVVNLKFHHPETTRLANIIETTSIITASCYHYDTIIVDLVDSRTNAILSRVTWFFDPLGNPVTLPLVNYAVAPTQLGYWALAILVYFAGSSTGLQFTVLVQPG